METYYDLYNTATEGYESSALMTPEEAKNRNQDLIYFDDPQRWIPVESLIEQERRTR
jgi:hypothetical protein